jgi:glutaredoxin
MSHITSEQLSEKLSPETINLIEKLDIIIFITDNCQWCIKVKEYCSIHNITDKITFINIDLREPHKTQEFIRIFIDNNKTGIVPFWFSRTTGKSAFGALLPSDLIKELE